VRLQLDRHFGELVEEQRAAVGPLEEPGVTAHGAREATLLVTEQLARRELSRERTAVDRDELAGPRTGAVNGLGDQLLTGAGLAENQHGARRARDLLDLLIHGQHRRRLADETAEVQVAAFDGFRALRIGVRLDRAQELGAADRLRQVRNRRTAQILDQRFDARMSRDEHDALHGAFAQLFEKLEPVAVGQHQIQQQHVGRGSTEEPPRALEPLRALDGVAMELEHLLRRGDKIRFVVY
jgi:hypothetical protein